MDILRSSALAGNINIKYGEQYQKFDGRYLRFVSPQLSIAQGKR